MLLQREKWCHFLAQNCSAISRGHPRQYEILICRSQSLGRVPLFSFLFLLTKTDAGAVSLCHKWGFDTEWCAPKYNRVEFCHLPHVGKNQRVPCAPLPTHNCPNSAPRSGVD